MSRSSVMVVSLAFFASLVEAAKQTSLRYWFDTTEEKDPGLDKLWDTTMTGLAVQRAPADGGYGLAPASYEALSPNCRNAMPSHDGKPGKYELDLQCAKGKRCEQTTTYKGNRQDGVCVPAACAGE